MKMTTFHMVCLSRRVPTWISSAYLRSNRQEKVRKGWGWHRGQGVNDCPERKREICCVFPPVHLHNSPPLRLRFLFQVPSAPKRALPPSAFIHASNKARVEGPAGSRRLSTVWIPLAPRTRSTRRRAPKAKLRADRIFSKVIETLAGTEQGQVALIRSYADRKNLQLGLRRYYHGSPRRFGVQGLRTSGSLYCSLSATMRCRTSLALGFVVVTPRVTLRDSGVVKFESADGSKKALGGDKIGSERIFSNDDLTMTNDDK